MDEVVLARHGESEAAARGVVGGDTPLTPRGRVQAQTLGDRLRALAIGICVTSAARRAQETAALALAGRDIPIAVDDRLGDVRFGAFDGRPLAEYRAWVESHPPAEAPAGGESRVETLRRFARAFRALLAREERCLLVVAHGLTVRSVLDTRPRPIVTGAPYGSFFLVGAKELEQAAVRLDRWCERPAW